MLHSRLRPCCCSSGVRVRLPPARRAGPARPASRRPSGRPNCPSKTRVTRPRGSGSPCRGLRAGTTPRWGCLPSPRRLRSPAAKTSGGLARPPRRTGHAARPVRAPAAGGLWIITSSGWRNYAPRPIGLMPPLSIHLHLRDAADLGARPFRTDLGPSAYSQAGKPAPHILQRPSGRMSPTIR